jgi:hypothetical protein
MPPLHRPLHSLKFRLSLVLGLVLSLLLAWPLWAPHGFMASVYAQDSPTTEADAPNDAEAEADIYGSYTQPFDSLVAGLDRQEGLFTTYTNLEQGEAYLAIRPNQINRNFMMMATLETGIGEAGLFRGWPINDVVFQFREAPNDRLQVVVPNTYIRNPDGEGWQQRLLDTSFSDSVIFAVDVISTDPASGAKIVDLTSLIMDRDLVNAYQSFGWVLGGYSPNYELSGLDGLKVFPENVEISTNMAFSGGGVAVDPMSGLFGFALQSLADPRGFSLQVRYSLSQLPINNGYEPRTADERVGYFISAFRAPFQAGRPDPFVRYINRWHLEKQDPNAALSAPKEPIVFWVENTVPPEYRQAIRDGILMWNAAFEQAGFKDAIQVYQMPDRADWDPADVRFNVVRWSDSLSPWAIGLGPSRVNPLTGEILDADIILDANTIRYLQQQYQTRGLDSNPETQFYLQNCGQRSQLWYLQWMAMQQYGEAGLDPSLWRDVQANDYTSNPRLSDDQCAGYAGTERMAFGSLALSVLPGADFNADQLDTYIRDYLVAVTAHEVGHTLGLRHNFAGSLLLSPEEVNDPAVTAQRGMVSSLMDYFPPNVAPPGEPQGDFFPKQLGPYDRWAIEYGYRTFPPSILDQQEQRVLNDLLRQSERPELAYAPDEDIWDFIDPEADAWDLTNDPMAYAQTQLDTAQSVWDRLNRWSVVPGEGYGSLRRRVDLVFSYYTGNAMTIANYVGGQRFRRVNPWDFDGQVPFEPIGGDKQRQALDLINQYVFAPDAFEFSPRLLNQLAPDRWWHWGTSLTTFPLDYPVYERVLALQAMVLSDLMYADRLARLRDLEFKATDDNVLTMADLYSSLHEGVWGEVAHAGETPPRISSLRRGLQRHHLNQLANLVLRRSFWDALSAQSFTDFMALASTLGAPEDARVLARYQLREIRQEVQSTLNRYGDDLAITTRAHLEDVRDRITQVLDASLVGQ